VRRKYLVWGGVAVVLALVVWTSLRPTVVDVEVATVAKGPLRVTVDEEGETRLRRRFVVSAPVSGRVLRIEIRPGDSVKAGQAVAVIEPAAPAPLDARTRAGAEARVRAAESAGERVRAERQRLVVERQQAEADAARAKSLFDAGYGSREALEQADARVRSLTEAVRAAEAAGRASEFELAEARAALISSADARSGRSMTVAAPTAGLVLRRMQESEAVVPVGAPLIEIGNLDDLEIVTDLLSTDAVKVKPGAAVVIDRWGGEGSLAGVVQRIEPAGFMKISALGVEEQRVNVVIDFVDPRERRASLGDGFRVEVRIVVWEKADVITAPTSSLFRTDGDWSVFVVEGDVVRRRTVKIGERNEQLAEVLEGLQPGDKVVAYPGESLTDGTNISQRSEVKGQR
jgi:HlyD family secretion protein